jgi:hypothetical protein
MMVNIVEVQCPIAVPIQQEHWMRREFDFVYNIRGSPTVPYNNVTIFAAEPAAEQTNALLQVFA